MITHHLVKVVKRAEREQPGQQAAGGTSLQTPPRRAAREQAARVKEWVTEFEQARPVRLQELRRELGWAEIGEDGLTVLAVRDTAKGEK